MQKYNKTKKLLLLSHRTPKKIVEISEDINREIGDSQVINSYSPSINKKLVSLKSVQRKELFNCNNELAFLLEAPLKIGVPDKSGKKICYPYDDPVAKKYMLKNLKANKHANPNKNCATHPGTCKLLVQHNVCIIVYFRQRPQILPFFKTNDD
jgi:hypothetical protein